MSRVNVTSPILGKICVKGAIIHEGSVHRITGESLLCELVVVVAQGTNIGGDLGEALRNLTRNTSSVSRMLHAKRFVFLCIAFLMFLVHRNMNSPSPVTAGRGGTGSGSNSVGIADENTDAEVSCCIERQEKFSSTNTVDF